MKEVSHRKKAKNAAERPIAIEWKMAGILSTELAAFKREISDIAALATTPHELDFLRAHPESASSELFLMPCAPLLASGQKVDWKQVEKKIQETIKQFYLMDITQFGEALKPLYDDIYFLGSVKEGKKLLGYALCAITPALREGQVKMISMGFLPGENRHQELLHSFFEVLPTAKSIFLYVRPTNKKEIQIYEDLGFLKNPGAVQDPNHKVNNNYLLLMEYTV